MYLNLRFIWNRFRFINIEIQNSQENDFEPPSSELQLTVHYFSNELSTKFWRYISHAVDSGLPSLRRWGKHCQVCDEFWGFGNKLRRAELPFERGSPAAILQFPSRQQKTKSQIIYSKAKGTGGRKRARAQKSVDDKGFVSYLKC